LETPVKEKRGRFSRANVLQRHKGERLIAVLRAHQKEFPRFAPHLEQIISKIATDAQRTRKADRDSVISALRAWGALNIRELIEETGLSHWDVRQVLATLIDSGKVIESRPEIPKIPPAARPYIYRLKG
jgi:hypothetical protein